MSKLPSLGPSLIHHLVENQRQMQRQATSSSFARSGTRVSAEGETTVDGELIVDGSETVNGTLDVTGDLVVSGHAAITGTLSLPAGIIDNEALAHPTAAAVAHGDNNAFAVTTTRTTQATATVTVPAGYSQALIFAEGNASAVNTTGVVDTILVGAAVNGVEPPGWAASQDVAPGGLGGATRAVVKVLTGLTGGGTFTVSTRLYSGIAGWAGNSANICNIDATILFLR